MFLPLSVRVGGFPCPKAGEDSHDNNVKPATARLQEGTTGAAREGGAPGNTLFTREQRVRWTLGATGQPRDMYTGALDPWDQPELGHAQPQDIAEVNFRFLENS